MKKLFFAIVALVAVSFASCNNTQVDPAGEPEDSTAVDSALIADSVSADTVATDTANTAVTE